MRAMLLVKDLVNMILESNDDDVGLEIVTPNEKYYFSYEIDWDDEDNTIILNLL